MKKAILGLIFCLVLGTGCSGGYQTNSYAISQNAKPVKTTTKVVPARDQQQEEDVLL